MRAIAILAIATVVLLCALWAASCDAAPSLWQAVPGGSTLEWARSDEVRAGVDVGGFVTAWKLDKWGAIKALAFDALKGGLTVWACERGWVEINVRIGQGED